MNSTIHTHTPSPPPPTHTHTLPLLKAAYRDNTLGLPCLASEGDLDKVSVKELQTYLASHCSPSRMVLAGVNVDHDELVRQVQEHFVVAAGNVAWGGVEPLPLDQSIAQYTGGKAMVSTEEKGAKGWSQKKKRGGGGA